MSYYSCFFSVINLIFYDKNLSYLFVLFYLILHQIEEIILFIQQNQTKEFITFIIACDKKKEENSETWNKN